MIKPGKGNVVLMNDQVLQNVLIKYLTRKKRPHPGFSHFSPVDEGEGGHTLSDPPPQGVVKRDRGGGVVWIVRPFRESWGYGFRDWGKG